MSLLGKSVWAAVILGCGVVSYDGWQTSRGRASIRLLPPPAQVRSAVDTSFGDFVRGVHAATPRMRSAFSLPERLAFHRRRVVQAIGEMPGGETFVWLMTAAPPALWK